MVKTLLIENRDLFVKEPLFFLTRLLNLLQSTTMEVRLNTLECLYTFSKMPSPVIIRFQK